MIVYLLFSIGLTTIIFHCDAYVLLQVRKGENHSNVDALIHKVIPTDKLGKFSDKIESARKQFGLQNLVQNQDGRKTTPFGAPTTAPATDKDGVDKLEKALKDIFSAFTDSDPNYRTGLDNLKKEVVHFRNDKPSVVFELNSNAILRAINDLLSSKTMKRYADDMAQKAAVIYRTVKEELGRED